MARFGRGSDVAGRGDAVDAGREIFLVEFDSYAIALPLSARRAGLGYSMGLILGARGFVSENRGSVGINLGLVGCCCRVHLVGFPGPSTRCYLYSGLRGKLFLAADALHGKVRLDMPHVQVMIFIYRVKH